MKIKELPSLDDLNRLFTFNKETGELFWKVSLSKSVKIGERAGTLKPNGYRTIQINGKLYREHRIVYALFYGKQPEFEIDHIDANKQNNSPKNLRISNRNTNCQNRTKRADNTSGYKNVFWKNETKKWQVKICAFGKTYHFGCYLNIEDAAEIAEKQRKILHGEFAVV